MTDHAFQPALADIEAATYEYSRPQRNPIAWVLAGLIAGFAVYGILLGGGALFWFCLGLFAVVNLWVVWSKTTHGLRIDDQTLTISPERDPMVISLPLIQSVQYIVDGKRNLVMITRRDGRTHKLDPVHFPRPQTLQTLLAPHDIAVSWT